MEDNVTAAELALILKITKRRVNQLADENVIIRDSSGKFNLSEAAENFYAFKFQSDGKIDFNKEHALFEKAKRKKAEMDLEERRKQLLKADEVEHLMCGMILTCKAKLLSLPARVAPKLINQSSQSAIVGIIMDSIYEALSELKEIPAQKVDDMADAVTS